MKTVFFTLLIAVICIYGKAQDIVPADAETNGLTSDLAFKKIGKDHDGGKVYLHSSFENKGEKLRKTFTLWENKSHPISWLYFLVCTPYGF